LEHKSQKLFIIAGEDSGDLHASELIKSIKIINSNIQFLGHGGNRMKSQGMKIIEHISNLSVMGFSEVVYHLPRLISIRNNTVERIKKEKPVGIILVDYPGFNLSIAKKLKKIGIPIFYFILPQVWAWKEGRIKILKNSGIYLLSIIPFEKSWFLSKGLEVKYVGHPFSKQINKSKKIKLKNNNKIILLLPGSRQQEIKKHLPIFLNVIKKIKNEYPEVQFLLGKSEYINLPKLPKYIVIVDEPQKVMSTSTAGIVSSGTATLECAVRNLPIVVCYKTSTISWLIIKFLSKIKYISIVNLILNKPAVVELLQSKMTEKNIYNNIIPLMDKQSKKRENILKNYKLLNSLLGKKDTYNESAQYILNKIN
tara:strand:+ start:2159 stop:3259 length:1101 start_codon:yes stop_codon:yes gene_type:complete